MLEVVWWTKMNEGKSSAVGTSRQKNITHSDAAAFLLDLGLACCHAKAPDSIIHLFSQVSYVGPSTTSIAFRYLVPYLNECRILQNS